MRRNTWLPVVLGALVALPLGAQSITMTNLDVDTYHHAVTEERRNIVSANLALGPEERDRFWSVYDDYVKEREPLDRERFSILQRYAQSYEKLSDDQAMALALASGKLQLSDLQLRLKYVQILQRKMSGRVAARFFQIDDYVTTAMRLNSLSNVPLVTPGR